jgi:hypothetical protein
MNDRKEEFGTSGSRLCMSLLLVSAIAVLPACVSTTPQWDQSFGDTVRMATAQQTINPDAGRNPDPVLGLDGRAAQAAIAEYQKSFVAPEPQTNVFTIGAGGQ